MYFKIQEYTKDLNRKIQEYILYYDNRIKTTKNTPRAR